jgi:hypothetical protein
MLFTAAEALHNNWFTVSGLPKFIWKNWTMPFTEIEGVEMSWEWYLRIQDVFFHNMLETYYECMQKHFVVVNDVAYPINSVVPKDGQAVLDAESVQDGEPVRDDDGDVRMLESGGGVPPRSNVGKGLC